MNSEELLTVLEHIEREKGIDKEFLFKAIESALTSAARKIIELVLSAYADAERRASNV